jgi:hypothetical protein
MWAVAVSIEAWVDQLRVPRSPRLHQCFACGKLLVVQPRAAVARTHTRSKVHLEIKLLLAAKKTSRLDTALRPPTMVLQ